MTIPKKIGEDENIAPEGGWGYMICIGFTIIFVFCTAPTNSFGIIFNDFLTSNGDDGKVVVLKITVCGILISLSGFFVNIGLKWFSLRQLSVMGSACYLLCWTFDIFVTKPVYLIFTNGVLHGIGWGMSQTVAFIIFNSYFVKKKVMLMSICMSVVGLACILAPFMVRYWMEEYGFRGTLVLMTGFTLNAFIGSALFQPVEWHLIPKNSIEMKERTLMVKNDRRNDRVSIDCAAAADLLPKDKTIIEEKGAWKKIVELTNLHLFKNITFCNICMGIGTGTISDIFFVIMLPILLFEYGMTSHQVATCVSTISFADLISRIIFGFIGKFMEIRSRHWFYAALIATFIARILFLQYSTFYAVCIMLGVIGFMRAWIYILYPLILAEELPNENYAKCFSLLILSKGVYSILFSPLLVLGKSITGSYMLTFYVLTLSALLPIFTWGFEFLNLHFRNKSIQKNPFPKQTNLIVT